MLDTEILAHNIHRYIDNLPNNLKYNFLQYFSRTEYMASVKIFIIYFVYMHLINYNVKFIRVHVQTDFSCTMYYYRYIDF